MKKENALLLIGLTVLGYLFYTMSKKKKPVTKEKKEIDIEAEKVTTEPKKTITLDMRQTNGKAPMYPSSMRKDFDTSKEATIAKPLIRVENM